MGGHGGAMKSAPSAGKVVIPALLRAARGSYGLAIRDAPFPLRQLVGRHRRAAAASAPARCRRSAAARTRGGRRPRRSARTSVGWSAAPPGRRARSSRDGEPRLRENNQARDARVAEARTASVHYIERRYVVNSRLRLSYSRRARRFVVNELMHPLVGDVQKLGRVAHRQAQLADEHPSGAGRQLLGSNRELIR